ncbi:MAG: serine hydrolase domain-containing protein [Velocimicrobium sp.]
MVAKKMRVHRRITYLLVIILLCVGTQQVKAAEQTKWETPSGISSDQIETIIDRIAEIDIGTKTAGCSVAIVKDGKIVFQKGYGMADIHNDILVDPNHTVFEYGSVSKLFTWISLMQLYERGKIDLGEDIKLYLPQNFKMNLRYNKPITVIDLMNHTAGFDDYVIGLLSKDEDISNLEDALLANKVRQINEPGFLSSYSNFGAGLAGFIVGNVAGLEEYEYIQTNIFDRFDMDAITINPQPTDKIKAAKSKAYKSENDTLFEGDWSYVPMYPAGAANGTVIELAKFAIALMDNESGLFQYANTYKELFTTSYTAHEDVAGVAHGFFEYSGQCRSHAFWHNGATKNFSSFFAVVPQEKFAVIALENTENEDGTSLVETIATTCLENKHVTLESKSGNLPDPSEVVGNYILQRRCTHGISKLINLFSPIDISVKKYSKDEITMNGILYRQVNPYVYQNEKDGSNGCFVIKDGKVIKFFKLQDYVAVSVKTYIGYGITYTVFFLWLLSLLGILFTFSVGVIRKLTNQKIKIFGKNEKTMGLILLFLIGLMMNIIVIFNRITDLANFSDIRPQIIVNSIVAVMILLGIWRIARDRRSISSKGKRVLYDIFGITTVIVLVILGAWGIFNPMS